MVGARYLSKRHPTGHWGLRFYQPKWISSHYTLLDLRNLCVSPSNEPIRESIRMILNDCKSDDGGVYPNAKRSDVCVNGIFLNYASYFQAGESGLKSIVDCLLRELMPDGGFNCRSNRSRAVYSSFHSTLSVLEGFTAYEYNGYAYRMDEIRNAIRSSKGFIQLHRVFLSDRKGKVINKAFLKLSYPRRWRYDILSALDYFQYSSSKWDQSMQPAIDVLRQKKQKRDLVCKCQVFRSDPF